MKQQKVDIGEVEKRHTGHFFSDGAKRFFNSRIASYGYGDATGRVFFVTSERFDSNTPRYYSVRMFDPEKPARIETVGEFQQYSSRSGADKAAQRLAGN